MQHGKYPFFFITGSTGSGKTYIIHLLINWLKLHQQKYMLLASTGVTAQNIGGCTIHSVLRLSQSASGFQTLAYVTLPSKGTISNQTIIIDEISMVSTVRFLTLFPNYLQPYIIMTLPVVLI